jgi:hypothetical protein
LKSSDSAAPVDPQQPAAIEFTCNICGRANSAVTAQFDREVASCSEQTWR